VVTAADASAEAECPADGVELRTTDGGAAEDGGVADEVDEAAGGDAVEPVVMVLI
jgi:hypothetical protein